MSRKPLPAIRLEVLETLPVGCEPGFLNLVRRRFVAHYPDGTVSTPFVYDQADRKALDAVVIAAHFAGAGGERQVYLRSAVRPPVAMREGAIADEPRHSGSLWELPAGLVEENEKSREGVRRTAQRELLEELGFDVPETSIVPLGPSCFPAPGMVAERQFFFEVEVDPAARREPELDGSPLEHFGQVMPVALDEALELCASGEIEDSKTELALRRLKDRFL